MKILYYDCFAGISGDMNLGAMIDLGVEIDYLRKELKKLPLDGYDVKVRKDKKNGIEGSRVDVELEDKTGNGEHRNLEIIENLINNSTLNNNVKNIALKIFRKLGEAEAHVHGNKISEIHFHEVGAVDSIVDIVGAAICFDFLKPDKILCSTIELGGGFVKCAHGVLPIPAPATVQILKGIPSKSGGANAETTTPTGAAILASCVDEFVDQTEFIINKIAYGIGHRDMEIPNVLRVFLGEKTDNAKGLSKNDEACMIESNIDDMNPELYDYVFDKLFSAGAMDVFLTPIIMKKGRPANKISVICNNNKSEELSKILLTETTSLGVRKYKIVKTFLERKFKKVKTRFGELTVKFSYNKNQLIGFKPEYEDCKKIAKEYNIPIREVYNEVNRLVDKLNIQ